MSTTESEYDYHHHLKTQVQLVMTEEHILSFTSNLVISIFIGLFLVVGSAGNILTILVIYLNKKLQSPSNIFIVSLSVSDFISAIICSPLWLYRRTWGFEDWLWGDFLCKFYWVVDFTTNYATALHIVSFAALRFVAVKWPFRVGTFTKRRVTVYICFLWILSLIAALPLSTLMGVVSSRDTLDLGKNWPSCSIYNNQNSTGNNENQTCCVEKYNVYMTVTSVIIFYIPEVCVIVLSYCIGKEILLRRRWRKCVFNIYSVNVDTKTNKSRLSRANLGEVVTNTHIIEEPEIANTEEISEEYQHQGQEAMPTEPPSPSQSVSNFTQNQPTRSIAKHLQHQRERNVFTQLGLIVLAFMIGYIPMTVYLVWTTIPIATAREFSLDYWFGVASYLCLRFSECMNPVMYNLGSSNIRKASLKCLKNLKISRINCKRTS